MIVVIGRPGLARGHARAGGPGTSGGGEGGPDVLDGLPALVACEAAWSGARVELVGSVGDDEGGDAVVVELGRAGVGHAALLRDAAGSTPVAGGPTGALPRLDGADLELGLSYLQDARVIIVAEALPEEARRVVLDGASYSGATVVVLVPPGATAGDLPGDAATVLEAPEGDVRPFARLVGRYAARLAAGAPAADAFREAVAATGWERAGP